MKVEDGRLLPAVTHRPIGMTHDNWEYYTEGNSGNHLALIGKLFRKMEKLYDKHGMDDVDGRLLADAYLIALDNPKHGGKIQLPAHLMKELKLKQ